VPWESLGGKKEQTKMAPMAVVSRRKKKESSKPQRSSSLTCKGRRTGLVFLRISIKGEKKKKKKRGAVAELAGRNNLVPHRVEKRTASARQEYLPFGEKKRKEKGLYTPSRKLCLPRGCLNRPRLGKTEAPLRAERSCLFPK